MMVIAYGHKTCTLLWVSVTLALAIGLTAVIPTRAADEIANPSDLDNSSQIAVPLVSDEAHSLDSFALASCRATVSDTGSCSYCEPAPQSELQKAVGSAYKNLFYDNSFSYVENSNYSSWHLGENLKRLPVCDWVTVDVGGQYRMRHHSERKMRGLGLTGNDDDFLLHRTRLFVNAEVGERVRFYGEVLDAASNYENFTPRPIEENRVDLQNVFLDLVTWQGCRGELIARIGRQELSFGAQRLVSPLDWANTRRTFEGASLLWRGVNWDIDGFWTRPLRRRTEQLDPPNLNQEFYGLYTTYKGLSAGKLDLFWIAFDTHHGGALYDTLGGRFFGSRHNWLYELEGGVQFGKNADNSDHSAGYCTAGLGRKLIRLPWTPTLWAYYDWASGDNTVGNGFDHFEPLAHKYLGFMDLFGRRNIQDANLLLTMSPHKKLELLAWYHWFRLANANDLPYGVTMQPFAGLTQADAGTGSPNLGQEIDLIATWHFTSRVALRLGYSHFFAGDFYSTTTNVPYDGDADFYYTQMQVNF